MLTTITKLIMALAFSFFVMLPAPAYAACPGSGDNSAKEQVLKGVGTAGGNCSGAKVNDVVSTVVNILSIIVGIAAIIMIIISGLKYITSGGDSNKVGSAKTTLIYALVGLAIAISAQFIVDFITERVNP
jgi:hypothetical protein